jgi:hypothetical protein
VRIFLSCAAASCSVDPSIGLLTHFGNGDLSKRLGHECQAGSQAASNRHISFRRDDLGGGVQMLG